jgi:hypothetical protein
MQDKEFSIEFSQFNEGFSHLAHIDNMTFSGSQGHASVMLADVVSRPGFLTQTPGLASLTNGTQAGVVDQLIRFILDKPTASDTTYAVGTTKLFKLSSTTVTSGGSPSWPQAITDMTSGESVIRLKANLYVLYNKASGGDIAKMPLSTEVIDPDWGSATDQLLENAPHPVAVKEDIMVLGNGRYLGVYVEGLATLDLHKLDFGEGTEVSDVVFSGGLWWIAVNSGEGKKGQIYIYDGSAISSVLSDEAGIGDQEIGFLYVKNGVTYVCYKDLTSGLLSIGFLSGRSIKQLRSFSGSLPDHRQKALYKNMIIFVSSNEIWSFGATVDQLPLQISKLADGGYSTVGGIASPFGTPLVASTESTNYRLAKFSGYAVDGIWKSIFIDITRGKDLGKIDTIIVHSKPLGANAACSIYLEGDQGSIIARRTSDALSYTGTNLTRKVFRAIGMDTVENFRVVVDFSSGDTTNDCPIRKIECLGTYQER